jgi:23S rRNA (uridine2552-2'-O)-methyltransferase
MQKKTGSSGEKGSSFKGRNLTIKLKKSKFSASSQQWLKRQLNDPYVIQSKIEGYRSRAAYKLLQIDQKFHIFRPQSIVIDLGAAPGGWTQIAIEKVRSTAKNPTVFSLDLIYIEPLEGSIFLQGDFLEEEVFERFIHLLKDCSINSSSPKVNVVLSDMAASSTGHSQTDHLRIMNLLRTALDFSYNFLAPQGHFVGKVLQGGTENTLLQEMKKRFTKVLHYKPPASRSDSAEMYVIGIGFKE